MVLLQEPQLAVRQVRVIVLTRIKGLPRVRIAEGAGSDKRHQLMGGIKHQPGDFLPAQASRQVRRPGLRIQPPVLIGQQLSRPRQVLEGESVLFQHGNAARNAQVFAALIADQHAVSRRFFRPAHTFSSPNRIFMAKQCGSLCQLKMLFI